VSNWVYILSPAEIGKFIFCSWDWEPVKYVNGNEKPTYDELTYILTLDVSEPVLVKTLEEIVAETNVPLYG
jgi:hypothetical protein